MGSYKCCRPNTREFTRIRHLSDLLKLVSDPNRLKLLCLLSSNRHCVCEMLEHFDMSQSLVSHHLADLKQAGLVQDQKIGRRTYYSLTAKGRLIHDHIFSLQTT